MKRLLKKGGLGDHCCPRLCVDLRPSLDDRESVNKCKKSANAKGAQVEALVRRMVQKKKECKHSKQSLKGERACERQREREGRETELAIWKTASFPALRSSPLLPSRHLSHAPEPSLQLPGSFPNSPEVRAVCVCMRACVCVCQVCEIRSLRARARCTST